MLIGHLLTSVDKSLPPVITDSLFTINGIFRFGNFKIDFHIFRSP